MKNYKQLNESILPICKSYSRLNENNEETDTVQDELEEILDSEPGEFAETEPKKPITLNDVLQYVEQNGIELTDANSSYLRKKANRPLCYVKMVVWDDGFDEYPLDRRLCYRGDSTTIATWYVSENAVKDDFAYFKQYNPAGFRVDLRVYYDSDYGKYDTFDSIDERYGNDWSTVHANFVKIANMLGNVRGL